MLCLQGCASLPPQALQGIDGSVKQAIYVHPKGQGSSQALLSAWQRHANDWHRVFLVRAVIGTNGLAPVGEKREGDGRTPCGTYPLGPAFGYAPGLKTGLLYRQATDNDFWVDDAQSLQYNQWIRGKPRARSFEHMRRLDGLYRYGIVVGYNMHPVLRAAGSAIFVHVWRRYDSSTRGCVAMAQRNLRKILKWLDQRDQPVIIIE
jgi:L,D-peptidoglycan transpeptidase YkuD (ErfK/YbiS/YcfS/YnhG family)